jgi:hypothetical protein
MDKPASTVPSNAPAPVGEVLLGLHPTVTQYQVLFYGSPTGYQGSRAQITLYNGTAVLGYVRFHDLSMAFPDDSQQAGKIDMHLPSSMFDSVLDVLRNEKPVNYYFTSSRAFLGTLAEPVGEAE